MRKSARSTVGFVLVAALLLAAASGCRPAPGPETDQNGGPKTGGTITVASGTQWLVLDPLGEYTSPEASVMAMVCERLVEMTPAGELVPLLAESWSVAGDNLTWTFKLKKGISFHDGTPFDAEAVKANFARIKNMSLGLPKQQLYTNFTEIRVVDEFTVEIVTSGPYGGMLPQLCHTSAFMLSPKLLAESPDKIARYLVGTGPFRMDEWAPGRDLVLHRNDGYWGDKPYIDQLVIKEVREPLTRVAMLETGEVDLVFDVPPTEMARFEANPSFAVHRDASTRVMWLVLNNAFGPLKDIRVRKAIKHAIDVDAITRNLHRGNAMPADNLVARGVVGYTPDPSYQEYDPDKAKALLAEAGYPQGVKLTLWTPDGRYLMDKESMLAIQAQLAKVGIEVDVTPMEWAAFLQGIRAPLETTQMQMYTWAWAGYTGDAEYNLRRLLWSESWPPKSYTPFYRSEQVDAAIAGAIVTTDYGARVKMLEQALELAREDHAYIYLWVFTQTTIHSTRVHDVTVYPEERFSFARAWADN